MHAVRANLALSVHDFSGLSPSYLRQHTGNDCNRATWQSCWQDEELDLLEGYSVEIAEELEAMLEDSMEQLAEAENRAEDLNKQLAKAKAARKRAESRLERVMDEIRRAKANNAASYDDDAATDTSTSVPLGRFPAAACFPTHSSMQVSLCCPCLTVVSTGATEMCIRYTKSNFAARFAKFESIASMAADSSANNVRSESAM